jgi:hypothetical protein
MAFSVALLIPTVAADELSKESLYFREDWKELPAATPVTQDHVANPSVRMTLHGPAALQIKKSHHDQIPNDPWYIWSGSCEQRWAISLRREDGFVDLSGDAAIRWRTRQSGPHILRVVLQLADGQWLVSRQGFGETPDWHVFEQPLRQLTWQTLEIGTVTEGRPVPSPDLSRVRSIGWTDLTRGNGTPGCTRVDWIEVYRRRVP